MCQGGGAGGAASPAELFRGAEFASWRWVIFAAPSTDLPGCPCAESVTMLLLMLLLPLLLMLLLLLTEPAFLSGSEYLSGCASGCLSDCASGCV